MNSTTNQVRSFHVLPTRLQRAIGGAISPIRLKKMHYASSKVHTDLLVTNCPLGPTEYAGMLSYTLVDLNYLITSQGYNHFITGLDN
jgi:hypothetical protein